MYKKNKPAKTTLNVDRSYEGETIIQKMYRIKNNREPITDGAPLIYTERSEGVVPEYDIRTDKFEIMIEANEKAYEQSAANKKAFEDKLNAENKKTEGKSDIGGPESIQATE